MKYIDKEDLNKLVHEKTQAELSEFKKDLLKKDPERIYAAAYEIITKEDIAECFWDADFSNRECRALLKTNNLVDAIYVQLQDTDFSIITIVEDVVYSFMESRTREERTIQNDAR